MAGDLPEDAQGVARAVIAAAQAVIRIAGSVLGFVLPAELLGALTESVKGMETVCESLG